MEKKYELIPSDKEGLFRVEALIDFGGVKAGDVGGYVESESNLSQEGLCWIYNDAIVCENAIVCDNARVFDRAKVYGYARLSDDANARDNAKVYENAHVYGNAEVFGNAKVYGNARVFGNANVFWEACVYGNARVFGNAMVYEYAEAHGDVWIGEMAKVFSNAKVYGTALVNGYASICGDAIVKQMGDYMVFQNTWSSGRYFTWTRSNNMWKVGCFYGTGEELIKKAYADSQLSGGSYETIVNCVKELLNVNEDLVENK